MFLQLSCVLASKTLLKTLSKQGPNLSKIESKNHLLFNIDVLGIGPRFWNPWVSKLGLSWPSWAPRTFPKACKIQSFAQGASQEVPKSLPRDPRAEFWNSWGLILEPPGSIWRPPGLVFSSYFGSTGPKKEDMYFLSDASTFGCWLFDLQFSVFVFCCLPCSNVLCEWLPSLKKHKCIEWIKKYLGFKPHVQGSTPGMSVT